MQTEGLIVRKDGPAKLDIQIKSDWLLICLTFVVKSPGRSKVRFFKLTDSGDFTETFTL